VSAWAFFWLFRTSTLLPLVAANQKHAKRKFAGIVLVSDMRAGSEQDGTVVSPSSLLLRHDVFSVEQLSSTVSEAGINFTSDKRLGQSFYNRVDYVADRIADESEIRRGKQFPYQYFVAYLNADDVFAR
jgi:hypothetical protein